ncbi:MAG TPA: glucose-6-phosphate isomerase, partial [Hellea balneolensis]|nr:glucose-6-phosphate isomerase [Hellea balneolensis]
MTDIKTAWAALRSLKDKKIPTLEEMFLHDPDRAQHMSLRVNGLYVDYSKQRICQDGFQALIALAKAANVEGWRARLFAGEKINTTENRAVLHPALRGSAGSAEIKNQIKHMAARTRTFAENIRRSKTIKTIVHIGIGGSDLGPRLCHYAFEASYPARFDLRFVVNVDGASINDALKDLDPATTLIISVSKSFTTQETRMNTNAALEWLKQGLGDKACDHMIAVTANRQGALDFGIDPAHIFEFWDWVGGRFSLWSAVSLSLQLTFGPDVFDDLLAGAREMDEHFTSAPLAQNLPVIMAMVGIWNRNIIGYPSLAVVPYSRRLRKLPAYLQQLEMESNGKGKTRDGEPTGPTCPVIWGDEGTNSQHAFFQHLHQSRNGTPVDFIAVLQDS